MNVSEVGPAVGCCAQFILDDIPRAMQRCAGVRATDQVTVEALVEAVDSAVHEDGAIHSHFGTMAFDPEAGAYDGAGGHHHHDDDHGDHHHDHHGHRHE